MFQKSPFKIRILAIILVLTFPILLLAQKKEETAAAPTTLKLSERPSTETDLVTATIIQKFLSQAESLKDVKVSVESGLVVFDGKVPTPKDSQWLTDVANKLPGVVTVIDKTQLRDANITDFEPMWKEFHRLVERFKTLLPSILFALLLLGIFYFMSGRLTSSVRGLWGRRILNPFLLSVVTRITLLPIWLLLFYFSLRLLGLSTLGATLIGGTGVLGIVLSLAFKGIAENYLAGLLLASRSPFTRGDLIQIGEYKGYVENLNMRGTTIIDLSGNLILIPNIMVIQSVVENQSANPKTRTVFSVGIGYHDSISRAQDLIIQAVADVRGVLADPPPSVVVSELGATRVELKVRVWFDVKEDREMRVRSRAMTKTKETLLANGFSLPNETRELVFTNPLKIENVETQSNFDELSESRRDQMKQQAASDLAEPESIHGTKDPSPEELLKQAENNPLPMNATEKDLLKK